MASVKTGVKKSIPAKKAVKKPVARKAAKPDAAIFTQIKKHWQKVIKNTKKGNGFALLILCGNRPFKRIQKSTPNRLYFL